jgi:hypothetical protein
VSGCGATYIYDLKYNNPPVANSISNQVAVVGQLFGYTLPNHAFVDPDTGNSLTLMASYAQSPSLGAWLAFDPVTREFSGTPTAAGTNWVTLMAFDRNGLSATNLFRLVVMTNAVTASPSTPLERWRNLYFGSAQIGDMSLMSALWGDQADADGDGVPNIKEYIFGSNPRIADLDDPSLLAMGSLSSGATSIALTFRRVLGDWYLDYILESSDDLISWTPTDALLVSEDVVGIAPDVELVTQHILLPSASSRHFYRLRVTILE